MKNKLYLSGVILMFIIYCCDNRIDAPPSINEDKAPPSFGLQDAKAWFETNATDLSPLHFNDSLRSKSPNFPVIDLIPEWDEALWSGHCHVSLIEVPIRTSSLFVVTKKVVTAGKLAYTKTFIGCRRLIIARRSNGETEMFLATIVPNEDNGMELIKNNEKFRYLGGSNFSGQVFCSTLEGHFFKAFEYQNGEQQVKFQVSKPSAQPATMQEASQQIDCITYGLQDIVRTKSTTYDFMEGPDPNCVCGGIGCDYCQKSLDDAEVNFCKICQKNIEYCRCCKICKQNPCSCGICGRCGHPRIDCTCRLCSNCNQYDCVCPICRYCGRKNCSCGEYPSGGGGNEDQSQKCPVCKQTYCICCPLCNGPCKCSGCHHYPCTCCQGVRCPDCGGFSNVQTRSVYCPPCTCPTCPICGKRRCKEIHEDCSGNATAHKKLANDNHDLLKNVESFNYNGRRYPSFTDYLNTIASNPNIEHSASMKYYEDEGVYRLDGIESGTENNVTIGGSNPGVVASIHSHPGTNPSPPSGRDILTSAGCAKDNPQFKYLYTYAGSTQYVLYIEDRNKAAAFYDKYKNDVDEESNMFTSNTKLAEDFKLAKNKLRRLSTSDCFIYSLAHLLEKNNSGIQLLKKDANASGFSSVGVQSATNGLLIPIECK